MRARTAELEAYRKELLLMVCTKKHLLIIYGTDDPEMKKLAREANQLTKIPLYDRHKILRYIHVKPLDLEAWK